MIKDKKTIINGLKRLSDGLCKAPIENHPSWDIDYDPLGLIWDTIDYVNNNDRVILNIVRDVLTSGGSIDTEADQDYICSVIEKRVEEVDTGMTNKEWLSTLPAEDWYSTVHWLFHVYGKRYTDTYSAVLSWLNETREKSNPLDGNDSNK